jgi:DNA-binding CsgD family transcriptional regulator
MDSLKAAIQSDDLEKWVRTCSATPQARTLLQEWNLSDYADPDPATWKWLRLSVDFQAPPPLELPALNVTPEEHKKQWDSRSAHGWMWVGGGSLVALLLLGLLKWKMRVKLNHRMTEIQGIEGGKVLLGWAMQGRGHWEDFPGEAWKAWTEAEADATYSPQWSLLSASERECARLLSNRLPVTDIATQLACSPSYVYNLRSSIRKKWNLAEHEDVVEAILAEMKGD